MDLKITYIFIVFFVICQRLYELSLAQKNEKMILSKGGKIITEELNYFFMVTLHTIWLTLTLYFSFKLDVVDSQVFYYFFAVFIMGQILRVIAIKTLKERWSTRIVILPEVDAVKKGIFNYIRHPNYLGVCLELFALPAMISRYEVAVIFSIINGVILYFRIKKEEQCLREFNNYEKVFS